MSDRPPPGTAIAPHRGSREHRGTRCVLAAHRVYGCRRRPRRRRRAPPPRRHPPHRPAARLRGRDAGSGQRPLGVRIPGALYNRLVRVDADGDLAPDLAESWEPDAQARIWTFRTREGVTFHDGRRLTAADAAYTLRHILDKATASPQAAVLAPLIDPKRLRTPDEHTWSCRRRPPTRSSRGWSRTTTARLQRPSRVVQLIQVRCVMPGQRPMVRGSPNSWRDLCESG